MPHLVSGSRGFSVRRASPAIGHDDRRVPLAVPDDASGFSTPIRVGNLIRASVPSSAVVNVSSHSGGTGAETPTLLNDGYDVLCPKVEEPGTRKAESSGRVAGVCEPKSGQKVAAATGAVATPPPATNCGGVVTAIGVAVCRCSSGGTCECGGVAFEVPTKYRVSEVEEAKGVERQVRVGDVGSTAFFEERKEGSREEGQGYKREDIGTASSDGIPSSRQQYVHSGVEQLSSDVHERPVERRQSVGEGGSLRSFEVPKRLEALEHVASSPSICSSSSSSSLPLDGRRDRRDAVMHAVRLKLTEEDLAVCGVAACATCPFDCSRAKAAGMGCASHTGSVRVLPPPLPGSLPDKRSPCVEEAGGVGAKIENLSDLALPSMSTRVRKKEEERRKSRRKEEEVVEEKSKDTVECDACEYCDDVCPNTSCPKCRPKQQSLLLNHDNPTSSSASETPSTTASAASSKSVAPSPCRWQRWRPWKDNKLTMCQIRRHNTKDSLWFVAHGVVYDATDFVDHHPGGSGCLLRRGGKDCTRDFDFHDEYTRNHLWKKFAIGVVVACPKEGKLNSSSSSFFNFAACVIM